MRSAARAGDKQLVFQLLQRRANVTLVNTPFMKQHHPWPSPQSLSNASIVLHGLKGPRQEHYRQEQAKRKATGLCLRTPLAAL